jgi:hypothetical protein
MSRIGIVFESSLENTKMFLAIGFLLALLNKALIQVLIIH